MKIVITSDTHFGDETSQLAVLDSNGTPTLGPKYHEFTEACGTNNDYLVMLGNVIDVAIEDYKDAYNVAKVFFQAGPLSMILSQKWFEFSIGRLS